MNMKRILEEAKALGAQIVAWRRELHQFPELGLETPQTEAYICKTLDSLGVPYRKGVGGHGVVALIEGRPGKCFTWRATATVCPSWSRRRWTTPRKTAACTPAATTRIPPWRWARHLC